MSVISEDVVILRFPFDSAPRESKRRVSDGIGKSNETPEEKGKEEKAEFVSVHPDAQFARTTPGGIG
jgi:hypothetical protein